MSTPIPTDPYGLYVHVYQDWINRMDTDTEGARRAAVAAVVRLVKSWATPPEVVAPDVVLNLLAVRLGQIADGALPFDDYAKDRLREAASRLAASPPRRSLTPADAKIERDEPQHGERK